jgi:chromosome segregation ATPase
MFAKRNKESKPDEPREDGAGQTAESGKDSRAGAIKQLEQQLAEARKAAGAIQEALDASNFKLEILEKSYAKQLGAVRDKLTATETELKEKDEILSNLGEGPEHLLRSLNDALAVIKVLKTERDQLKAERDQLRKLNAQGGYRQRDDDRGSRVPLGLKSADDDAGGTINELIANPSWLEKRSAVSAGHSSAQVSEQESPQEEMISPDAVFTEKDRDDSA